MALGAGEDLDFVPFWRFWCHTRGDGVLRKWRIINDLWRKWDCGTGIAGMMTLKCS
jgi:hypothetical protein